MGRAKVFEQLVEAAAARWRTVDRLGHQQVDAMHAVQINQLHVRVGKLHIGAARAVVVVAVIVVVGSGGGGARLFVRVGRRRARLDVALHDGLQTAHGTQ